MVEPEAASPQRPWWEPVRLRFHLTSGKLFAFWISADRSGASHGCVAGGPGFTGSTDTEGSLAYPNAR